MNDNDEVKLDVIEGKDIVSIHKVEWAKSNPNYEFEKIDSKEKELEIIEKSKELPELKKEDTDKLSVFDIVGRWQKFCEAADEAAERNETDKTERCFDSWQRLPLPPVEAKSVMIFYIYVGDLSPQLAENFVDMMKNKLTLQGLDRLPKSYLTLWFPIRSGETRVEIINL